ncbi:MAG: Uncharacterised protein [Owenweeksia sp. TMED14]|nr:MAG: Uncharacterised protein [Owenweeksia sp. TMED14]
MKSIYIWAISLIIFLGHQISIQYHFSSKYLDSWLDPLVFIPVSIGTTEYLFRLFYSSFKVEPFFLYGYVVTVIIFFEIIIPLFDSRFTADFIDVIAYFIGAYAYSKTQ